MNQYKILLGSHSPRRRQLLQQMDIEYEAIKIDDVDEIYPAGIAAEEVPVYLSRLKADAHSRHLRSGELLITADTVVIVDGQIVGKPVDIDDAKRMLKLLSGRSHKVVTGVTLTTLDRSESFSDETLVTFNKLPEDVISRYVEKYRPLDKAGAYGIQEFIGMIGIKKIDGCFYNVMGLPTGALYEHLQNFLAEK